MKKITALMLILLLVLAAVPALAEGKLEIEQENLQVFKPYSFVIVKIANAGDAPIRIQSSMDMIDTDDEVFRSGEYNVLGDVLQPGEFTYAYFAVYLYGDTEVGGYKSVLTGAEDDGSVRTVRYESRAELVLADAEHEEDCIFVSFTNNTGDTVFSPFVSGILTDGEGNLLYLTVPAQYDLGITAGSTVIYSFDLPPYVMENVDIHDLAVDSVVYTNEYAD